MRNSSMKSSVVTVLIFCFLSGSTAWAKQGARDPEVSTGADGAGFTLTEQSLDNLQQEGLPREIVERLEALKDQRFNTEGEFLEAVRKEIGDDQTVSYKAQILKHAKGEISEIQRITQMLQAQSRAIEALQAQNRALAERLAELEAAQHARVQNPGEAESQSGGVEGGGGNQKQLEERVEKLEAEKAAQEEATRSIIRQAISTLGSKINESVSLGGSLEVLTGWHENFSGPSASVLSLNTAELDFEIQVTDWALASLILEFVQGTDVLFPTTTGFNPSGVDRFTVDTAFITIGNLQRFPPFVTVGQIILPFGISTGDPVADVLTIEDPLTIEVFEMRNVAIGFGAAFPTPAPTPPTPPVTPPPVRPLLVNPLISLLMGGLGYDASLTRPRPPTPIIPTPAPPLFNAGFYLYNGDTFQGLEKTGWDPGHHIDATVGFRTKGYCGRPFDQLAADGRQSWLEVFCPWSIDVDVDFNSSIFDSRFLSSEYQSFLGQIGFVPAIAPSVKATLGPVSLVGEWNGAIRSARFVDDSGTFVNMNPSAWEITLGYQLDWNPWVEAIGAQGTFFAIGYSESYDLGGVTDSSSGEPTRVGFVPRRRFLATLGEWILEGVRFRIEYSYIQDYSKNQGGTGNSANGFFSTLTYVW